MITNKDKERFTTDESSLTRILNSIEGLNSLEQICNFMNLVLGLSTAARRFVVTNFGKCTQFLSSS